MSPRALLLLSLMPLVLGQLADLRFSLTLDTEGRVVLRWDFDKTTEEITFELQVATTGWIGFGLNPSGGWKGADMVIGGVSTASNQTTYFADYHGIGEVTPIKDTVQNYQLEFLSENEGLTTMRFSRKFITCDPFDVDITANTQRIIAAYGNSDTIVYHGPSQRFMASVQLLSDAPVSGPDPEPSFTNDIKMSNFSLPSDATTYGCADILLPQLPEKHHIYKGGIGITEEMCLAYLLYYPKNDITVCLSIPVYKPVSSSLGFDIISNPNALNSIPWTTDNIALLQKKTKETLQYNIVIHSNKSFVDDFSFVHNISDSPETSCTV